MFGGYDSYMEHKEGELYKKIVPAGIRKALGNWAKKRPDMRGLNFIKRNALDLTALKERLEALFADEATVRRITWTRSDEPAYIEIKAFFNGVLADL